MTFYISTKFKVYLVRLKSGSMKIDEEKIGGGIAFFFYLIYMQNRVKKKKKWVPRCFPPVHPKLFSLKWGDKWVSQQNNISSFYQFPPFFFGYTAYFLYLHFIFFLQSYFSSFFIFIFIYFLSAF